MHRNDWIPMWLSQAKGKGTYNLRSYRDRSIVGVILLVHFPLQSVEADPPWAFHLWFSAVTSTIVVCAFRFFPDLREVEFSAQDLEIENDCVLLAANGKKVALNKKVTREHIIMSTLSTLVSKWQKYLHSFKKCILNSESLLCFTRGLCS